MCLCVSGRVRVWYCYLHVKLLPGLKVNDGISALEPLQNRQPLPLGVATGVATGNNKTLEQGSAAQKVMQPFSAK